MAKKDILNHISALAVEAVSELSIEELETHDNSESLAFIRHQKFKLKAELNKEKYALILSNISEGTKEKIEALKNLSLDALIKLINQREVKFQFRNLEKLEEDQIREIITDLYLLDELKNED